MAEELQEVPGDSARSSELADALLASARRKRSNDRIRWGLHAAAFTGPLAVLVLLSFGIDVGFSVLGFMGFSMAASLLSPSVTASSEDLALTKTIRAEGGVEAIGPLAESSRVEGTDQQAVADALLRVLPNLRPSNALFLTAEQRRLLFDMLRDDPPRHPVMRYSAGNWEPYREPRFRVALLEALGRLGDPAALPYVAPHCERDVAFVRPAALACRAAIESARRTAEERESLLRPADGGAGLLRATLGLSAADPEVLLRAEESDR